MRLAKDDEVISMSILRHIELDTEERDAYLRWAKRQRREEDIDEDAGEAIVEGDIDPGRAAELAEQEEYILAITQNGFGKRTSAYEYRITRRGGQGIINIETSERNGPVANAFPVASSDQIMLITDGGRLIRVGMKNIRIASRNTQGVTLFKTDKDERVVSVAWMAESDDDEADAEGLAAQGAGPDIALAEHTDSEEPDAIDDARAGEDNSGPENLDDDPAGQEDT